MKISEQRANLNAWLQSADKVLAENDNVLRLNFGSKEVKPNEPPDEAA